MTVRHPEDDVEKIKSDTFVDHKKEESPFHFVRTALAPNNNLTRR
jgi:hypothetical protein